MNSKLRNIICVLLCLVMAVSLTGTALAFDNSNEEQNITVRITLPQSYTGGSAAVEVCIIDNAGAGFKSAQVKAGYGSWHDVTAELNRTGNRWYCVVDITESCTIQVRVFGLDGTVYEKSGYIQCYSTTADYWDTSAPAGSGVSSTQPYSGLTTPPGGQGTVIDNVTTASGENEREFFTITTPNANVFYLVIDRQRNTENVYFLNAVTESDLMALAEKDTQTPSQSAIPDPDPDPVCVCKEKCVPGEVDANCPVCVLSYKDCTGVSTVSPEDPEPVQKSGSGAGTIIIVLAAALAVGGAGWYLKVYKPKKELEDAEDLDELTGGGEEPTVNEDDVPPEVYDEPGYPEGYGDDA